MTTNIFKSKEDNESFISVLNRHQYSLNLGDVVAGSIFSKESNGYLVDVGDKKAAFLPKEETFISNQTNNHLQIVQEFFILSYNTNLSQLILSTKRLQYLRTWKRIKQLREEDIIIYVFVINENSGGLLINIDGVCGFLPNSHIVNLTFKHYMINTIIPVKFLSADEQTHQIILSHKRAVLSFSYLTLGKTINTKIIKIINYGIFVKIQNLQALLHISEIPKITLYQLKKVAKINKPLKVMIIHIDKKQARLSVSIKKLFITTNHHLQ